MRKLNTILSVLLLFICLLHGLMGSFMLLGISSGAGKFLAWIGVGILAAHTVLGLLLTAQTFRASRSGGKLYGKQNALFWARRTSGLAILLMLFFHIGVFGRVQDGVYILFPFTTVRLLTQLLLVASVFVHLLLNLRPLLVSLGIVRDKEQRGDLYLILSILVLFAAGSIILYYIGVEQCMKHTLVIVGAGLAGLSAALTAVKNGWTVKLVSSLASERAQSVMAEGGINAALNTKGEEDSPEQHYTDTLTAACGLADPNAVWGMTQAASELVRSLHHLGVQFNVTDDDELDLRNFGGQKKKRTAFAQSDTGKQLMTALIDAVRREESAGTVERFPHHKFRTLLLSGNICGGCTVQDTYTGELLRFVCDAVLIATGGLHGLFGDTTGSLANTGEVTAELFRLGVPMANLEMIQYHPTTVELGEKRMLLSEAARGEGGRLFALRNRKPWYFMEEKYPELGNLMPRDITAREVWTVSRDYEVFLDMTELPKEVMEHKLAGLVDDCQTYLHKDIRKEPIPILPGIHYFMGGIQVDERHRTSMRNLYAAGECCAQYHGANRLGGNSLLGAIYGGQIAAETACRETVSSPNMPCAEESLLPELSPDAQMQMNRILLNALGVVRDAQTLEAGIQEIRKLSGTLPLLGCAMLESALARKESRGAHWRADYPQRNDAVYCKTTVAHWNGQHIAISFESIPERRHDL